MPALLLSLALVGGGVARGADARGSEEKARYLLSCTEYVEWPERAFTNSMAPLVIGIVGEDPFGDALTKQLAGHRGKRQLEVRRFKGMMEFRGQETPGRRQDGLSDKIARKNRDLRKCHVLYVSRSEDPFLSQLIRIVRESPVLTVGDAPSFARRGGVIGFYKHGTDSQLRFEINLAAAEAAKLKVSSTLLALAKVIRPEGAPDQP